VEAFFIDFLFKENDMKKFKVLFERSNGEIVLLGFTGDVSDAEEMVGETAINLKNASKMIKRYLTKFPNFQHYYTKINGPVFDENYCQEGERMWCFDVGSWSEFFYVVETVGEWEEQEGENEYSRNSIEMFVLDA
jgi:hypothetical protein